MKDISDGEKIRERVRDVFWCMEDMIMIHVEKIEQRVEFNILSKNIVLVSYIVVYNKN